MRIYEESRQRWRKTDQEVSNVTDLKALAKSEGDKDICVSGLRSVYWKVFLLFRSVDTSTWTATTEDSRAAYTSLKDHFLRFIERPEELGTTIDPLTDDENSPWNSLRRDEELCAEIIQDVERCMPDEPYFRLPETQKMLLDILFIYCKINQDIGYRQGMHELVAPILWVMQKDALAPLTSEEIMLEDDDERLMIDTLNPKFIEHDAFTLFSLIMRTAKSFYELGEAERGPSRIFTSSAQYGSSPIIQRSKQIHEVLLAQLDPELASHLTQIEILPQIFLIRWIRLLFGREFSFNTLLSFWDKLFAEDPDLQLIDMVCVSMLLRIRWQLLDADYSVALTLLLKYPPTKPPNGPRTFVEDAMYLRDNLSLSSGAKVIAKYTGKTPVLPPSIPGPSTPAGGTRPSPVEQNFSRRKSNLPSPGKYLQQQGGVEAILQGAAKGVFERGERLGINQAVRDAVGEVKKNIQGLAPAEPSGVFRRTPGNNIRSPNESRPLPLVGNSPTASEARNKALSRLLDEALEELQKVSESVERASTIPDSTNNAIKKLQFIRLHLNDSSLPLPLEALSAPMSPQIPQIGQGMEKKAQTDVETERVATKFKADQSTETITSHARNLSPSLAGFPIDVDQSPRPSTSDGKSVTRRPMSSFTQSRAGAHEGLMTLGRPTAMIPTRSTLAQSSFAWMLGPDEHSAPSGRPLSPESSTPFSSSGRKPVTGVSREKNAFLFGDDPDVGDVDVRKPPMDSEIRDAFSLEAMKKVGI